MMVGREPARRATAACTRRQVRSTEDLVDRERGPTLSIGVAVSL